MSWLKKEAKAFGREFARQGSILIFGKAPKHNPKNTNKRKISGAERQYNKAQSWAKRNGFK